MADALKRALKRALKCALKRARAALVASRESHQRAALPQRGQCPAIRRPFSTSRTLRQRLAGFPFLSEYILRPRFVRV